VKSATPFGCVKIIFAVEKGYNKTKVNQAMLSYLPVFFGITTLSAP
jgi:hypothetical protein